jgi:hypothetical protein
MFAARARWPTNLDRYYFEFQLVRRAGLVGWAGIANGGPRDMLAFNSTGARAREELEGPGGPLAGTVKDPGSSAGLGRTPHPSARRRPVTS